MSEKIAKVIIQLETFAVVKGNSVLQLLPYVNCSQILVHAVQLGKLNIRNNKSVYIVTGPGQRSRCSDSLRT